MPEITGIPLFFVPWNSLGSRDDFTRVARWFDSSHRGVWHGSKYNLTRVVFWNDRSGRFYGPKQLRTWFVLFHSHFTVFSDGDCNGSACCRVFRQGHFRIPALYFGYAVSESCSYSVRNHNLIGSHEYAVLKLGFIAYRQGVYDIAFLRLLCTFFKNRADERYTFVTLAVFHVATEVGIKYILKIVTANLTNNTGICLIGSYYDILYEAIFYLSWNCKNKQQFSLHRWYHHTFLFQYSVRLKLFYLHQHNY